MATLSFLEAVLSKGREKRFLWGPSVTKTLMSSVIANSEMFTERSKASDNPTNSHHPIASPVSVLLGVSSPPAVRLTVTEAVILPVQRKPVRLYTHILQKIRELFPAFTNGYATTAVVFVIFGFSVAASLNHSIPSLQGWRCFAISFVPVNTCSVPSKAATGNGVASIKVDIAYCFKLSALALTNTERFGVPARGIANYIKPSKCFPDERNSSRHGVIHFIDAVLSSGRSAVTDAHYEFALIC